MFELVPEKVIADWEVPPQYSMLETWLTVGVGFTVIVNVIGVPEQPLAVGVTVKVATTGLVPLLVKAVTGIVFVPEAAIPIEVVSFVQLKVVPETFNVLAKVTSVEFPPLQTTWLETALTVGVGFTVTSTVSVFIQPLASVPVTV